MSATDLALEDDEDYDGDGDDDDYYDGLDNHEHNQISLLK